MSACDAKYLYVAQATSKPNIAVCAWSKQSAVTDKLVQECGIVWAVI